MSFIDKICIGKELSPDETRYRMLKEDSLPGFIDIHVHLRDPGYGRRYHNRSKAAAVGGFTTVCCMPNTDPVVDEGIVGYILRKSRKQDW